MKRVLTSLVTFLIVFVVFALIISPLRSTSVNLTVLFFPTIHTSAEALAYISFLVGFLLAGVIGVAGDMAIRRRFRTTLLEQRKRLEAAEQPAAATATTGDPENERTRSR